MFCPQQTTKNELPLHIFYISSSSAFLFKQEEPPKVINTPQNPPYHLSLSKENPILTFDVRW
jgi:hypothetical protein